MLLSRMKAAAAAGQNPALAEIRKTLAVLLAVLGGIFRVVVVGARQRLVLAELLLRGRDQAEIMFAC